MVITMDRNSAGTGPEADGTPEGVEQLAALRTSIARQKLRSMVQTALQRRTGQQNGKGVQSIDKTIEGADDPTKVLTDKVIVVLEREGREIAALATEDPQVEASFAGDVAVIIGAGYSNPTVGLDKVHVDLSTGDEMDSKPFGIPGAVPGNKPK